MIEFTKIVRDADVQAGWYQYVRTHSWVLGRVGLPGMPLEFLRESVVTEWIPADYADEWLMVNEDTGRRQWLQGSQKAAASAGLIAAGDGQPQRKEHRMTGGRLAEGQQILADRGESGCWQIPTVEFFAGLPREPGQLLSRLRADSPTPPRFPGYVGELAYALDALRGGLVPADLRAALYEALLLLPKMRLVEQAVGPDGTPGYALVLDHSPIRTEVFVDADTGHFMGERSTSFAASGGKPSAGTVTRSSAVVRSLADGIGLPPFKPQDD